MAEEILNISGVIGNNKTNLAVTTAAKGITMSGLTEYLDKKHTEMVALVNSVTTPAAKYFSDIMSELKANTTAIDTWNELVVDSLLGISTQVASIANAVPNIITIQTSADSLANNANELILDALIDISSAIKTNASNDSSTSSLATNSDEVKAKSLLYKMIVDNEAFIKNLKLSDILNKDVTLNTASNNDISFNIQAKSNFDVRSLTDFLNTTKIYNPIYASLFKRSFATISETIAKGIVTISSASGKVNIDLINSAGESLVKLGSLIATTRDIGGELQLFGKSLNFKKTESIWTKKNANEFKNGFKITEEALTGGIQQILNIKNFGKNGVQKLDTILKFMEGVASLLQGELQTSKGVKFSIGSLLNFNGDQIARQIKSFNEKNANKFKNTAKICADALYDFFARIGEIQIDEDKFAKVVQVLFTLSDITLHLSKMKMPKLSAYIALNYMQAIVDKIFEIKVTKKHTKNLEAITEVIIGVGYISDELNKIKKPKNFNIINTLVDIWLITTFIHGMDKVTNNDKKNLAAVADIVDTVSYISISMSEFKKPRHVKSMLFNMTLMIWVLGNINAKTTKAAQKNVKVISGIVIDFSKSMDKVSPDAYKTAKKISKSMNYMAISILLLATLGAPAKAASKSLTTITSGIARTSKVLGSRQTTHAARNMKMLAIGMATLGLASVAFAALSPVILVACLGMKLLKWGIKSLTSFKTMARMKMFTVSLATFGLAIWAFGEIVSPEGMLKTAGGIAMLAGAMYLFNGGGKWKGIKTGKGDPTKNMVKVAGALALLGLATYVWQELVDWGGIPKVAVGIGMLAGTAYLFNKINPKAGVSMLGIAAGVAAFGAATFLFSLANPSWETIGMIGAVVGGAAAVAYVFNMVTPMSGANMLLVAAGVAAFGGALWLWNQVGPTWNTIEMVGALVGGGAAAAALYAIPIIPVGAASMMLVGTSLVAMVGALAMAKNYGITKDDADNILTVADAICTGYAKLAILAVPALLGATLFTPVALETVIIAGAMSLVALMPVPEIDKINTFNEVTWSLCKGFSKVALLAIPAALGATLFLPVAAATVLAGGAMALIALLKVPDPEHVEKYMSTIKEIASGWNSLGIFAMMKAAAKSALFIPVAASTVAAAVSIKAISELEIDRPRLEKNTEALFDFVETTSKQFNEIGKGKSAKSIKKGVEAVGAVANVLHDIADVVYKIASLEYVTHKINSKGELIPDKVLKLTDKDFEMVGQGVAKILIALTDPLIKIGEANGEDVKFGPFKVPGKNKVEKGVQAISGIGGAIAPLADLVKSIAETGILDKNNSGELVDKLAFTIKSVVDSITDSVVYIVANTHRMEVEDPEGLKSIFESTGSIFEPVSGIIQSITESGLLEESKNQEGPQKWQRFSVVFSVIVDSLSSAVSKIVSFVKSKGGFWNSSDTNAEGIVTVLNNISSLFAPLDGILKAISSTGILDKESSDAAQRLTLVVNAVTDSLSSAVAKIIEFSDEHDDADPESIAKTMSGIDGMVKPISRLLLSIKATGILDADGEESTKRLKLVIKSILSSLTSTVTDIIKFSDENDDADPTTISKVMGSVGGMITPISVLIATLNKSGVLDDSNTNGVSKIKTVLSSITDAIVYTITKIAGLQQGAPALSFATSNIANLFAVVSKADPTGIQSIRSEIDAIYEKITDDTPWKKFGVHLVQYEKVAAKIQKDINKIDLKKLILIKEFTDNLRKANLNGNIQTLVEEIRHLINAIEDQTAGYESTFNDNSVGGNTFNNNTVNGDVTGDQNIDTGGGSYMPTGGDTAAAPSKNSSQAALNQIADRLRELTRAIKS